MNLGRHQRKSSDLEDSDLSVEQHIDQLIDSQPNHQALIPIEERDSEI